MKSKKSGILYFLVLCCLLHLQVNAQAGNSITSPDGKIVFDLAIKPDSPQYTVTYRGYKVIDGSELNIVLKGYDSLTSNLVVKKITKRKIDRTYQLTVGKTKTVAENFNEKIIELQERSAPKRNLNLVIRVFDDGLAFRYEFPKQKNWSSYQMMEEASTFNIYDNPKVHTLFHHSFLNSHEGLYKILSYNEIKHDVLMDIPTLFEFSDGPFMAITEANLRDYAGMYLKKHSGKLVSQLSPLPGQERIKVKADLPHKTPWRVIMLGDKIGTLIESNILTSLNEPSKIKDESWIKPGKTSFYWWNGYIIPDTTITPGNNFETNKYYIDFCARNHIEYHSVIGYGGVPWYKSDAVGFSTVGPNTEVTEPVPSLDMQKICDYARDKGVDIHVWVNWKAIYPNLEKAFSQFEKWGIKGMMVDFLNRDDQEMVNIQEEILRKAAEHKLFIQFHGAYKPTGLNRTYPNEFTREGTYNYEMNKFVETPISPEHDLNVVFTRLLAGATDYHLGGFRAVPPDKFKPQFTRPLMIGTRCHMLAMYVVLESYLTSLCDYPKAYEGQPGFEFLKEVPTVWDETRVPVAKVDEFVTVARRKEGVWYVGGLNNSEAKSVTVPLNFLSDGKYKVEIYQDAEDAEKNPNHLEKQIKEVEKNDELMFKVASGGGFVMRITKKFSSGQ